ncbi:hypothetical protein MPNT_340005 [Candidatus Methylacidithermus pantelleriae]|uniref:Uncharacterized protein n=1 Tax=Candidatus Methylacidithermus pantelleriae TaxID=2744239 RepID=A0A8J2BLQ6_9BACT|nr:hypothetical protein MPNT_340005 [Candidatus Methylacidithermus pantelleriae]
MQKIAAVFGPNSDIACAIEQLIEQITREISLDETGKIEK